ncbi:hypothetical protein H6F42_00360 [Pseudanabaena sp. FACHB-1998]|uniref:hypothetical protein n=1 Tax=Pseudanabaena sp. FACHB-1998 TaxID=2692858 RepID=UPI0016806EA4|nr:hypothetical protein [Pseudanabaena sp. FACHB-1998]MBD2175365.1 hypothetical protein [Pseudanabaena sp. FACHB-1998]
MADELQKSEQPQDQNALSKPHDASAKGKESDKPADKSADKPKSENGDKSTGKKKENLSPKKRFIPLPKLVFLERLPRLSFPKPKVSINLFKFGKSPEAKARQKLNLLWFWLLTILVSYTLMGYFLSVLLTMRSQKNLAIAGFITMGLLPVITAFADYGLMKWGYLISGFLIVGGLIFLIKIKFYFLVLAIMTWIGITMIAFVGEYLIKQNRKFFVAIIILTFPCLIGLGLGWQVWRLVATNLS